MEIRFLEKQHGGGNYAGKYILKRQKEIGSFCKTLPYGCS